MGKHKKRKREDDELYQLFKKFTKKMKKRTLTSSVSSDSDTENDAEAPKHAQNDQETLLTDTTDNIPGTSEYIQETFDTIHDTSDNIHETSNVIHEAFDAIHEASDPTHEASGPLDDDILNILGEDPNKKIYSVAVHKDIASRWNYITDNGMEKEKKTELCKLYPLPENCFFLEAPKVNAEIKAAVSEQVLKRDKAIEQQQSSLGQATACIGKALDILIKNKECKEATKILSDAGRMMCDLFHTESMSRRYLLQFALNKNTKDIVTQTKVGKYLFGDSLHEDLKAGKAINKTGSEIKYNSTQANKQTKPTALNSRGPPRRYRPQYTPSAGSQFNKPQTTSQRWPAPQRGPAPQRWSAPQRRGPPQKKT